MRRRFVLPGMVLLGILGCGLFMAMTEALSPSLRGRGCAAMGVWRMLSAHTTYQRRRFIYSVNPSSKLMTHGSWVVAASLSKRDEAQYGVDAAVLGKVVVSMAGDTFAIGGSSSTRVESS